MTDSNHDGAEMPGLVLAAWSCDSIVKVAHRLGLVAALESTNETVTDFLEQLVGEGIDAVAHHHHRVGAPGSNDLQAEEGEPLLERAATLRGRRSGSPYVYAESVIAIDRLPMSFRLRLESSLDPIGRILRDLHIPVSRRNLGNPGGFSDARASGVLRVDGYLHARTYRIDSESMPLMVITEWFLKSLDPFLVSA